MDCAEHKGHRRYVDPPRVCPTCGEEIDADDEGCPDDGGTA